MKKTNKTKIPNFCFSEDLNSQNRLVIVRADGVIIDEWWKILPNPAERLAIIVKERNE